MEVKAPEVVSDYNANPVESDVHTPAINKFILKGCIGTLNICRTMLKVLMYLRIGCGFSVNYCYIVSNVQNHIKKLCFQKQPTNGTMTRMMRWLL